ncbi:paramyosin-like [Osmia bicornis bicornis]|uniref:paramyosin-like n=1 Tax=Osmia bicornis bicornis TaxID=1437191 RepID=UPI0010F51B3C|nr:paramyosin-like [Osmia bicornis bicornis]
MSFSKARIQRFNELENDVPAPGAYDPKFDSKVKGIVLIEKSERFHDDKSVASAECSLSVCAKSTPHIKATFRTPQLPRKKIRNDAPRSASRTKPRSLIPVQDQKLKYESQQHLADLQVECSNKDRTIKEQEKHIEDMKEEVQKLQLQLEELFKKQSQITEQHKKDMEAMAELQQEVLNGHDEKYQGEVENLHRKLLEATEEKGREIQARKEMEVDLKNRIAEFSKRISVLEIELANKKYTGEERIKTLENQIAELTVKMENLTEDHKNEMSLLAQEKSELNSRIHDLSEERDQLELKLQKRQSVVLQLQTQLSALECELDELHAEYEKLVEDSAKEVQDLNYKHYKEIEKMEATVENKKMIVSAKDAEITTLSMTVEQLRASAETQESFSQSLQMELDRAETELAEKKEELRALKDQIRTEAAEMVSRRKRFEIVMAENQASVAALTTRLAQSNAEVERLQHELKCGEDCINEHRDLLTIMRNNSQMVHEQMHTLMEQLNVRKGLVDQIEVESMNEIESAKSLFEAKIEDLKQIATKEVGKLKAECTAKTTENAEIKKQLHEMASHLNDARNMLLKLEETNDSQQIEISRVELLNTKLSEQLKEREEIVQKHDKLLEEQAEKYEAELNEAKSKIQDLYDKIKNLEERNKHLKDKVELFQEERHKWETADNTVMKELEKERSLRETLEVENKNLAEDNERLAKNYEEINEKYAELVGHCNHRQRIKHLSHLKDKITQLEQEISHKTRIIEHQQKTIDKLKAEDKRSHIRGKENMLNVTKTVAATPLPSPHKSLTPLRSRND